MCKHVKPWQEGMAFLPEWCRQALAWSAAVVLWFDPSSGLSTAILWAAGGYALWNWRRAMAAWRHPAGVLFGIGVGWAVLSWGWSFHAEGTARDLIKSAPLVLAVGALPLVFDRPGRIWAALIGSAGVVTVRLGVDLFRVFFFLGWPSVLEAARFFHPYLYTHPNVSSMMAGLSALVLVARGLSGEGGRGGRAWLGAGVALDLAYLLVMGSRGPQAVFGLMMLAMLVVLLPGWRIRLVAAGLAVAVGAGLVPVAQRLNPRFRDTTMGNFNRRDTIWGHAKMLADQRPVAGHGYGKKAFIRAVYDNPEQRAPLVPFHYPHSHSYWLMLYFQGGAVALVTWSLAWLVLMGRLGRLAGRAEAAVSGWRAKGMARALPVLLLCSLAYILVYGIGDYPDHVIRQAQFYLAGLSVALAYPVRGRTEPAA